MVYSVVEKHVQTMLQLLDLVHAACIVDIPVPQIEQDIAEVD